MNDDERKKFILEEIRKEASGCEDTLVKWHKAVAHRKEAVEELGLGGEDVKKLEYMIHSARRIYNRANKMKELLFGKKEVHYLDERGFKKEDK